MADMGDFFQEYASTHKSLDESLGNVNVSVGADSKRMEKDLEKAKRMAIKKMKAIGKSMEDIGMAMTKAFTVPLSILSGSIMKFGMQFEKAMTNSLAIMGSVSNEMRTMMEDVALSVSTQTMFSAKQLGEAYFYLASAGMDVNQALKGLPQVARFAQAGLFDLSRATSLLNDAQKAMGLSSKNAEQNLISLTHVSDVLVKANTMANATTQQFAEALTQKAGAALRLVNKDIEEGVAVLAAFADQGKKSTEGGQYLYMAMRDLQRASIRNRMEWEKLEESMNLGHRIVWTTSGSMRGMADIIEDLSSAMGELNDERKRSTLLGLGFQDRAVAAVMMLLGTSDKLREYEATLRSAAGTTDEVANKQLKNFHSQLGLVWNRLVKVKTEIYRGMAPSLNEYLIPALNEVADIIQGVADGFNKLEPEMRAIIISGVALSAIIGPLTLAIGKLTKLLAAGTLITLGTISFWLVAIAAILYTGVIAWRYYGDEISATFDKLKDKVTPVLTKIKDSLLDLGKSAVDAVKKQVEKEREDLNLLFSGENQDDIDTKNKVAETVSDLYWELKAWYLKIGELGEEVDPMKPLNDWFVGTGHDTGWMGGLESLYQLLISKEDFWGSSDYVTIFGEISDAIKGAEDNTKDAADEIEKALEKLGPAFKKAADSLADFNDAGISLDDVSKEAAKIRFEVYPAEGLADAVKHLNMLMDIKPGELTRDVMDIKFDQMIEDFRKQGWSAFKDMKDLFMLLQVDPLVVNIFDMAAARAQVKEMNEMLGFDYKTGLFAGEEDQLNKDKQDVEDLAAFAQAAFSEARPEVAFMDDLEYFIDHMSMLPDTLTPEVLAFFSGKAFKSMSDEGKKAIKELLPQIGELSKEAKEALEELISENKWAEVAVNAGRIGNVLMGLPEEFDTLKKVAVLSIDAINFALEMMHGTMVDKIVAGLKLAVSAFNIFGDDGEEELSNMDKMFDELGDAITEFGDNFIDVFIDFLKTGEMAWTDFVNTILEDLLRITMKYAITEPLTQAVGGMMPFAKGGVISMPTIFPMAKGLGMAGEAGAEAVLPLSRTKSGDLGVVAQVGGGSGSNIEIIDQRGVNAPDIEMQTATGPDGEEVIRLIIREEVARAGYEGALDGMMENVYGLGRQGVRR